MRRRFVRAGDANPAQLKYWTEAWLDRIRDLYHAHDELMAAWHGAAAPAGRDRQAAAARLEKEHAAWDDAITVIDAARKKQMAGLALDLSRKPGHTERHGHRLHRLVPSTRTDGVAVAACCHGDTPENTGKTPDQEP